ncbi:lymphocyte antigen 75-like isoform X2 [Archocentrus centrarchus]|nr:lymphocyte antigen 75-like isoform X2 [Archocentrus centrarchus]
MIGGADCQSYYFFICDHSYFNPESKTWSEARDSCQRTNLANYNDQGDVKRNVNQQDFPVWIGLYREGETWNWSAGVSDYTNWVPHEPMNNGDCVTISSLSKQTATHNCSDRFPFICYGDNLLLVNENKTWEEALEYCRALSYELVSVQPEDYDYMRSRVMEANTEEVWTGLRFLAGEWLWVNGADMMYSDLPLCPPMVQHCGTLSKSGTGSMEIRDCAERRNFLCYWM